MRTDRSRHPIVHFVGSIPLPDSEIVFRPQREQRGEDTGDFAFRGEIHWEEIQPRMDTDETRIKRRGACTRPLIVRN